MAQKEVYILFPNQIFDINILPKPNNNVSIILYQHKHYYNDYNYNKKKLILLRACFLYYYDYLINHKYNTYTCLLNQDINEMIYKKFKNTVIYIYDPIDDVINIKNSKYILLESPNFMLNSEQLNNYKKKSKSYHFYGFYNFTKKEINYLVNIKSKDEYNRNAYDYSVKILDLPIIDDKKKYIKSAINWVERYFNKNIGTVKNFNFPITHKDVKVWLHHFLNKNFDYFGYYQDSIIDDEPYMFHSVLSSSLNIGLIQPMDIIQTISSKYNRTIIQSREGYLRQLIWREFMRYTYLYVNFNKNYFNHNNKINKDWYNATTYMTPVDNAIKSAIELSYSHHINRLMVLGNWMTLTKMHPNQMFRWFMEVYIDAYEWVMYGNVEMASFATNGTITKRPYFSSSNYILKMSNYKNDDTGWVNIWNDTYHNFLKRNKKKLYKYRYHFRSI